MMVLVFLEYRSLKDNMLLRVRTLYGDFKAGLR